jgi:3-hydroxyisobutyrate dehydrogenase-like beta-hydroxyacid dehydrogenase
MNEQTVAVLGLGLIGSIWAGHYRSAGKLSAVWSRRPKPNLDFELETLSMCASSAKYLHLCLFDSDSVKETLNLLCAHLDETHTVIQSTTIDPVTAKECAAQVEATGARYIEAPFTGSKPAAEAHQTVYFLGANTDIPDDVVELLSILSSDRFMIGTPAQAASIKLAMNLQIVGLTQALCESIHIARGAGVSDDTFFEVMKKNVAWSGLSALKEPKIREADFTAQFSVKNMHKDMRLAKVVAGEKLPLLNTVNQCLESAEKAGHGDDDFLSLLRLLPK